MSDPTKLGFPLPDVLVALDPYLKTRQEALQVRRVLTLYMSSGIQDSDQQRPRAIGDALSFPTISTLVTTIPEELSGTRREFLEAIRANVTARTEYDALVKNVTNHANSAARATTQGNSGKETALASLPDLLELKKTRRRYEGLQIMQDYADTLSRKPPAATGYLDLSEALQSLSDLPEPPKEVVDHLGQGEADFEAFEELIGRLETTVIRSKYLLDSQRRSLEQLKANNSSKPSLQGSEETMQDGSKLQALGRTRNELIEWIEGELARSAAMPPSEQEEIATREPRGHPRNVRDIKYLYPEYIKARRSLVATLVTNQQLAFDKSSSTAAQSLSKQPDLKDEPVTTHASSILANLSGHLCPLSHQQKTLSQVKSLVATGLAKEIQNIEQTTGRLAEESHLLTEYPLLAGQARFKNASTVLASRAIDRRSATDGIQESVPIRKAREWSFATNASRTSMEQEVHRSIDRGEKNLSEVQELLVELRGLLGVGDEKSSDVEEEEEEEDMWAASAKSPSKMKAAEKSFLRSEDEGYGPWRGLRGDIGLIGDGP